MPVSRRWSVYELKSTGDRASYSGTFDSRKSARIAAQAFRKRYTKPDLVLRYFIKRDGEHICKIRGLAKSCGQCAVDEMKQETEQKTIIYKPVIDLFDTLMCHTFFHWTGFSVKEKTARRMDFVVGLLDHWNCLSTNIQEETKKLFGRYARSLYMPPEQAKFNGEEREMLRACLKVKALKSIRNRYPRMSLKEAIDLVRLWEATKVMRDRVT